jgi:hypothetical protein
MMKRNKAYTRARLASEEILSDAYRAADQLSADVITDADVKFCVGQIEAAGYARPNPSGGRSKQATYPYACDRSRPCYAYAR